MGAGYPPLFSTNKELLWAEARQIPPPDLEEAFWEKLGTLFFCLTEMKTLNSFSLGPVTFWSSPGSSLHSGGILGVCSSLITFSELREFSLPGSSWIQSLQRH